MNNSIKLIKYLMSNQCSDINSKIQALNSRKIYLSGLEQKIPSNIYSIYDELGLIPEDNNIYENFIDILIQYFDINCDILEVAGGNIPRLAIRLSNRQMRLGRGTITVIDPTLSVINMNYPNIKLCREQFDLETIVDYYDLIVSLFPCEVTEIIIYKSLEKNKNLFIKLCNCVHKFEDISDEDYNYYILHPEKYRKVLLERYSFYAKCFERKMDIINEQTDSPILICKKKKL